MVFPSILFLLLLLQLDHIIAKWGCNLLLEPLDQGQKALINKILFNVNSRISQLRIMIIFIFYLSLKYSLVLPLKLRAHHVSLVMKQIKFFSLTKRPVVREHSVVKPSSHLKMTSQNSLLNCTKAIQNLMTSYEPNKTNTMPLYFLICKYRLNCITQNK